MYEDDVLWGGYGKQNPQLQSGHRKLKVTKRQLTLGLTPLMSGTSSYKQGLARNGIAQTHVTLSPLACCGSSGWWLVSETPQPLKFCSLGKRWALNFCLNNPQSPVTRSLRFALVHSSCNLDLQHLTLIRSPPPFLSPASTNNRFHRPRRPLALPSHILPRSNLIVLFRVGLLSHSRSFGGAFALILLHARRSLLQSQKPNATVLVYLPPLELQQATPQPHPSVIVWSRRHFTAAACLFFDEQIFLAIASPILACYTPALYRPRRSRRRHVLVGHASQRHRPFGQGVALCKPGAQGLQDTDFAA